MQSFKNYCEFDECWTGYVQRGMKKKGDRMVPNCVPAGGSTKEEVAAAIKAGQADFKEKVVALYADMLKIKQEFKSCATIKELNVLYQTYMGFPVPAPQAEELGDVHIEETDEGQVQTVNTVEPGLKI